MIILIRSAKYMNHGMANNGLFDAKKPGESGGGISDFFGNEYFIEVEDENWDAVRMCCNIIVQAERCLIPACEILWCAAWVCTVGEYIDVETPLQMYVPGKPEGEPGKPINLDYVDRFDVRGNADGTRNVIPLEQGLSFRKFYTPEVDRPTTIPRVGDPYMVLRVTWDTKQGLPMARNYYGAVTYWDYYRDQNGRVCMRGDCELAKRRFYWFKLYMELLQPYLSGHKYNKLLQVVEGEKPTGNITAHCISDMSMQRRRAMERNPNADSFMQMCYTSFKQMVIIQQQCEVASMNWQYNTYWSHANITYWFDHVQEIRRMCYGMKNYFGFEGTFSPSIIPATNLQASARPYPNILNTFAGEPRTVYETFVKHYQFWINNTMPNGWLYHTTNYVIPAMRYPQDFGGNPKVIRMAPSDATWAYDQDSIHFEETTYPYALMNQALLPRVFAWIEKGFQWRTREFAYRAKGYKGADYYKEYFKTKRKYEEPFNNVPYPGGPQITHPPEQYDTASGHSWQKEFYMNYTDVLKLSCPISEARRVQMMPMTFDTRMPMTDEWRNRKVAPRLEKYAEAKKTRSPTQRPLNPNVPPEIITEHPEIHDFGGGESGGGGAGDSWGNEYGGARPFSEIDDGGPNTPHPYETEFGGGDSGGGGGSDYW